MSKQLIFHIGTPKTGTTAIQAFCYQNKDRLRKENIDYPNSIGGVPQGIFSITDGNLGNILNTYKFVQERAQKICELIGEEEKTLISSEKIWFEIVDKEAFFLGVQECRPDISIKVIVYLRNQWDYLESNYRQFVKGLDMTADMEAVYNAIVNEDYQKNLGKDTARIIYLKKSLDYYSILKQIERAIGKENIIVRNYDTIVNQNINIYKDFADCLGIVLDDNYVVPQKQVNPSLDVEMLEIKRIINCWSDRYGIFEEINPVFFSHLMRGMFVQEGKNIGKVKKLDGCLSLEQRQKIWEVYKTDNDKIAKEFLGEDKDLFIRPIEKKQKEITPSNLMEKIVLIMSGVALEQNAQIKQLQKSFNIYKNETQQALNTIKWGKNVEENINEKNELNRNELEQRVKLLENEKKILERNIFEKQAEIDAMKNGYSWKITTPLRKIRRFFCEKNRR